MAMNLNPGWQKRFLETQSIEELQQLRTDLLATESIIFDPAIKSAALRGAELVDEILTERSAYGDLEAGRTDRDNGHLTADALKEINDYYEKGR